jgi:triosephosphate isomerase
VDLRPLFVANWKMNLTEPEVTAFLTRFKPIVPSLEDRAVVLSPSYPSLRTAAILTEKTGIEVAAQDLFPEPKGAYTGAVSARMVAAVGCRYVLAGHSERRHIWNEEDALVNRKVKAALDNNLAPILCVGETAQERQEGRTEEVVERQVRLGLEGVAVGEDSQLAVAYEPVWAIGTGDNATPDQAEEVHRRIQGVLADLLGPPVGAALRILYGGSATPDNAEDLMARPAIRGLLVGGASLNPESFAAICSVPLNTGQAEGNAPAGP